MTAIDATALTLAIGDGGEPESFTEIGGLTDHRMALRNTPGRHHHANLTTAWEEALPLSGRQQLTVSGQGVFTDSPAEENLRALAFANNNANFQISLGNGDTLTGAFNVTHYERSAGMEAAITYQLTLQSAGEISFSAAT